MPIDIPKARKLVAASEAFLRHPGGDLILKLRDMLTEACDQLSNGSSEVRRHELEAESFKRKLDDEVIARRHDRAGYEAKIAVLVAGLEEIVAAPKGAKAKAQAALKGAGK